MNSPIKPAGLTGALVSVKGQALTSALTLTPEPAHVESTGYWKSLTLKLDQARFRQLKRIGLDESRTSQSLLVEALDMLLRSRNCK